MPGDSGGGGGAGEQGYTVRKGDTLSAIAQHHYGKASRWHAIFDANRDQLDDPDLIKPGQVLRLPAIND
ncbi:LysM peptidoglycan-binding domain-containing protein [Luteimonas sp. 50]|uniref:LysM peptidoglycan-binding domain-containing protein n=1 Tax=Cognatiluteimonas sedimenti TaxID=2927791 RepID=A0ABT0A5S4_9GAMM|nr:LysM peptidoglycan-binding domain-containing protein [Lysobacter sedimenti]MCJ0826330.1 LysM peptidoglycan-binding domain-containing protein [Lysobacter sedimenti]